MRNPGHVSYLSQGVTELLCITFSVCDRYLLAVIWVLLCDCAAGTRGISRSFATICRAANGSTSSACGCSLRILVFLNLLGSLALFVLPILSMGLYAEERKRGTLDY